MNIECEGAITLTQCKDSKVVNAVSLRDTPVRVVGSSPTLCITIFEI